jgi:rfaE bifunctional protein nucleotidyltransferase chain/domain
VSKVPVSRLPGNRAYIAEVISRATDNAIARRNRTESRCYTLRLKVSNVPIRSRDSIAEEVRQLQASGKKIVFTNGCFDVLHPGHLDLLERARALGDVLVIAINGDDSVKRLKGPKRPVFPETERGEILSALDVVDYVCTFNEDTPLETILEVRPDILVKGADWIDNIVGSREVEGWGGRVVALPLVPGQSTTGVIERVLEQAPRQDGSSR